MLQSLINSICVNSIQDTPRPNFNEKDENLNRLALYLYGEAGTGKTRFVNELSKTLKPPMVSFNL